MSNLNRHPVRRTAAGVLASALAFSGAFAAATPAHAAAGFTLERIAGVDRYDTSARTAAAFDAAATVTNVILASGENGRAADALGASFLAGVRGAPVLLTPQAALAPTTSAALTALRAGGATTVTIVGGPTAVSANVAAQVTALGFTVNRLAGQDRFGTAEAVVAAGEGTSASNVGILASGLSTVDALAVGPLAYKGKHPIFLTRAAAIPASTIAAMRANGVTSVYIVGGTTVISAAAQAQLTAAGITVVARLGGADRSETSRLIAEAALTATFGFTNTTFNVASGANDGVDALSGAALSGLQNRPLLITNTATNAGSVIAYATAHASTLNTPGIIFGGPAAVSEAVETAIETAAGGTTGTGPITLAATTAAQGASFTGTIANPGTVQSLSVTGCGFTNQPVTVSGSGGLTLSIPAAQAAGACNLTFSTLRTNGTTETQTVAFTVTAAPTTTTAAPDLVSAAVNTGTGVVTYTFDQNVTGLAPVAADFYLYDAAGNRLESSLTQAPQVSGSTVLVQFTTAQATAATLAAAGDDAVQDAAGRSNYAASAPLGGTTAASGITDGPDLQSVDNLRVQGAEIVADFRFDEAVATRAAVPAVPPAPGTPASPATGSFQLVAADGSVYTGGGTVVATSVDNRTISVSFGGTTTVPIGSIVRGVVQPGAVNDAATGTGNPNVLQTEPRTGTPAFTAGVLADRTDDPDLTNAVVAGTNVLALTFDEAVSATAVFGNVFVYDAAGNATPATSATRSATDTSVVNVTFATPAAAGVVTVGTAVGVSLSLGAVTAVDDSAPNAPHERGLQALANTAGRTGLPDLVSVRVSLDAFSNNTVAYTFDSAVTAGQIAASAFGLVDANGILFSPVGAIGGAGGTATASNSDQTYTFTFTNAQAAAAVVGNVEDLTAGTNDVTTGDVPVQR